MADDVERDAVQNHKKTSALACCGAFARPSSGAHPQSHASELGVPHPLLEVPIATQRPYKASGTSKSKPEAPKPDRQTATLLLVTQLQTLDHAILCLAMLC